MSISIRLLFLFSLIGMISCSSEQADQTKDENSPIKTREADFQSMLDSAGVIGTILIYDMQTDHYYANDFEAVETTHLPASTFKIPNSIIGLESGILKDDQHIFKWDGEDRRMSIWEADLSLKEAFSRSCVPCYQELAREIGADRMNAFMDAFQYGDMDIDSTNIDQFWLMGDSRISPMEQIDFLKRFYRFELPISKRTVELMKSIMIVEEPKTYRLSGKTGWSITGDQHNGWFVGYLENRSGVYFFATNVSPDKGFDMSDFPAIRKALTVKALKRLNLMPVE